jgi:hypothetical protein
MAKKQTYAAAMKQLSKKKATYEQGLAEAKRTMNASGIKDYERRLGRLSAGMDELFQAQEVSKNPQFGLGGSTMQYGYGGRTRSGGGGEADQDDALIVDGGYFNKGGMTKYNDGGFTAAEYNKWHFANSDPYTGELKPESEWVDTGISPELVKAAFASGWTPSNNASDGWDGSSFPAAEVLANPDPGGYAPSTERLNAANTPTNTPQTPQRVGNIDYATQSAGRQSATNTNPGVQADIISQYKQGTSEQGRSFSVPATDHRQPGAYIDDKGNYLIIPTQDGGQRYVTPAMKQAMDNGSFGHKMSTGAFDTADDYIGFEKGYAADGGGNTVRPTPNPSPYVIGEQAPLPATTAPLGATAATLTPTRPENVAPVATRNGVGPLGSPVAPSLRSESDDFEIGNFETDYIAGDEVTNTLSPVTRAQYAAAEDAYDKSQGGPNFFQKNKQTLGMAAGMAAQFIPDFMAKRNIRKMEGPADMPQMRAQTLNTDIQVGKGLEQIRNSQARMNESVAQNFSNPAVAAAMLRANERSAQAQAGNVLFREAQGENQLRNQNINQLTNTINQNAQIGFQNQQRGIDFENERMGAINRVNMQMGQKLGGAFNDFQTRAQDQKKWEMYAKVFNEDMLKRQGIDPLS